MSAIAEAPRQSLAEHRVDPEKLRLYTRRKLAIAAQVRAVIELLKKRGSEARVRRCEELMVKIAEDRFTLAVLGQFKRGKSSLMNAIIGRELLPTGVLPLTSAITVLKFGPTERLVVRREGSVFPEIVPVSALAQYVTENGNPGNRKKVSTATVEVPLPFLRRGLEFVDTPGIGSAIEANTATTYSFLPQCDAALFVTSVDTPLTASELDFLRAIREHVRKIFFVVNKIDLMPDEAERDRILHFIRNLLWDAIAEQSPRIFPVSARARNGTAELQDALASFLADEKSDVFLNAVLDKALGVIAEETGELELHRRAQSLSRDDLRTRLERVRVGWKELQRNRSRLLDELRADLVESTRELAAAQLDDLFRADATRLRNDLELLVRRGGSRFGEELAERWARTIAQRTSDHVSNWLHNFTSELKCESQRLCDDRAPAIEANLREIAALAASAFEVDHPASDKVLPRLDVNPAFSQDAAAVHEMRRATRWFYWVPAFLVRPLLRKDLLEQTCRFFESERERTLDAVAKTATNLVEAFAKHVHASAMDAESRLTATITGEIHGDDGLAEVHKALVVLRDPESPQDRQQPVIDAELAGRISAARRPDPRPIAVEPARDLKTRGCAVCEHIVRSSFDFFAHWQYAIASDQSAQTSFANERGFCPLHLWQLHALSSPVGESIGLAGLMQQTATSVRNAADSRDAATQVSSIVPTSKNCRVCELLRSAENDYIRRLAPSLGTKAAARTMRAPPVCACTMLRRCCRTSATTSRKSSSRTQRRNLKKTPKTCRATLLNATRSAATSATKTKKTRMNAR